MYQFRNMAPVILQEKSIRLGDGYMTAVNFGQL
jgi:hypothetical protein